MYIFLQATKIARLQSATLRSGPPFYCPSCDYKTENKKHFEEHVKRFYDYGICKKSSDGPPFSVHCVATKLITRKYMTNT